MPLDYQLVENFMQNIDRLHVPEAIKNMSIPMLSIHGSNDPTVPITAVREIGAWNPGAIIEIIEGADHTFGGGHPFEGTKLPEDLDKVVGLTMDFFKSNG